MMKIVTVCCMGIGTSVILKLAVEQIIQDYGILAEVSYTDKNTAKNMDADVFITTTHLAPELSINLSKPVIRISSIVNIDEIYQKLNLFIQSECGVLN